MQRELFYEESAVSAKSRSESKIYMAFHIVSIVFLIIVCIQIFFSFSYVGSQVDLYQNGEMTQIQFIISLAQWFVFIAACFAVSLIFFFLKRRFNVSYDYTFVEDELRVSKVFNGKKRKFFKKFEVEHIMKIGWAENDSFERTRAGMSKKNIVMLTPNKEPCEGKEFYYLLYSSSMEKTLYILEARQEMLEYLVRAAGVNKLERR